MTTYCICTPVGRWARGLPSDEAAREAWKKGTEEREFDEDEAPPVVTFETTRECEGEETEEHTSILEDGHEVACIWREAPAWPERGGPELAMWATAPADCRNGVLGCKMDPHEARPRPLIVCAGCGTEWRPM